MAKIATRNERGRPNPQDGLPPATNRTESVELVVQPRAHNVARPHVGRKGAQKQKLISRHEFSLRKQSEDLKIRLDRISDNQRAMIWPPTRSNSGGRD